MKVKVFREQKVRKSRGTLTHSQSSRGDGDVQSIFPTQRSNLRNEALNYSSSPARSGGSSPARSRVG
ncbi:hypothetical protein SRHO_G00294620 [Serrasalmus rhombeus]